MANWRPVYGQPNYDVSDEGEVRSYRGPVKTRVDRNGYVTVSLSVDGKAKTFCVNRLVLSAFVRPPEAGEEALHGPDPSRTNNRLCNLRWGTHKENEYDKAEQNSTQVRLSADAVKGIRVALQSGVPQAQLAREYGVHPSTICKIASGLHH